MKTQIQHYYDSVKNAARADETFMVLVKSGMTRGQLSRNISRRPSLWTKYSNWLEKLPN